MQYEIQPTISDAWRSSMPAPAVSNKGEASEINALLDELQKKIPSMSHWTTSDGQELVLVSNVLEALERAKDRIFAPHKEELPKCIYHTTISKADIERGLEIYKEEGYKKRYIDLFHFDIVLRYLSHCKGPLYSTTEILEEDEIQRIMDNDSFLAVQQPTQIIRSFNEVLDYIGPVNYGKE